MHCCPPVQALVVLLRRCRRPEAQFSSVTYCRLNSEATVARYQTELNLDPAHKRRGAAILALSMQELGYALSHLQFY